MKNLYKLKEYDATRGEVVLDSKPMKKLFMSMAIIGIISCGFGLPKQVEATSHSTKVNAYNEGSTIQEMLQPGSMQNLLPSKNTNSQNNQSIATLNLGTGSSGGGDGVLHTNFKFYIFPERDIKLLDFAEHGLARASTEEFDSLHPEIIKSKEDFRYVTEHVCAPLEMTDLECIGLTNKMYELFKYAPAYYVLLKNKMLELDWVLVERNDEVGDEGGIYGLNDNDGKFQLAHRKNGIVSIQRSGWIVKYKEGDKKYRPLSVVDKVGTITHEIIYDITQKQGDSTSKRAREINAKLYWGIFNKLGQSYELLTGKKIEIKRYLLSQEELRRITRYFLKKYVGNYPNFYAFGLEASYSKGDPRSPVTDYAQLRIWHFLDELRDHLVYYGQYSTEFKYFKQRFVLQVPSNMRKTLSPYTKYINNFYRMSKGEWIKFVSSFSTEFFPDWNSSFEQTKITNENGIFLDQIALCKGSKEITIPSELKNKDYYFDTEVPNMRIDASGSIYLSYDSIAKDKYLSSPNLCVKYNLVRFMKKISLVIELVDDHPFIGKNKNNRKQALTISQKVSLVYDQDTRRCVLNSDYLVSYELKALLFPSQVYFAARSFGIVVSDKKIMDRSE